MKILEIKNIEDNGFNSLNLFFNSKTFYSIIGGNKSGKTTLFNILSGIFLSNGIIICDNISIKNINYIKKIGVVRSLNKKSFHYKRVIDELSYPLYNLNYHKGKIIKRINEVINLFNKESMLKKNISDLNEMEKQELLIIISLLHKPKVLMLDGVFDMFTESEKIRILNILNSMVKEEELCIINFTSDLSCTMKSDKLIILNNFNVVANIDSNVMFENDKLFYENNLETPFMCDLLIKLKMYNLNVHVPDNLKEMVNDIWQ